jgi:hypothetical protein
VPRRAGPARARERTMVRIRMGPPSEESLTRNQGRSIDTK